MHDLQNPFALVKASDFSDSQINELWVELGTKFINAVIEPRSRMSKYILGGKGTGKTHLLRYHSYTVARLRAPRESGLRTIERIKFLGIFVRATNIDAGRFEPDKNSLRKWQQLFGVYFELRLAEGLLEALLDIKSSSNEALFSDQKLIAEVQRTVHDSSADDLVSVSDLLEWVQRQRKVIDRAVDNSAFTGDLDVEVPFSIGTFCIPLTRALTDWNSVFSTAPVIFLIDEIENFSELQQEVINSLVRYGEGVLTFRITGRLYSVKTLATISQGEANREGSEFTTIELDDILRKFDRYPQFARDFISKRLVAGGAGRLGTASGIFDPLLSLENIQTSNFYQAHVKGFELDNADPTYLQHLREAMQSADASYKFTEADQSKIEGHLANSQFPLLRKLNVLIFCKKLKKTSNPLTLAIQISNAGQEFAQASDTQKCFYKTAYGHYAVDLFAQLCRESKKMGTFYAGFETFVKMSSGNPRNLLICLGRLYEIATFREIEFATSGVKLSIAMQSEAAAEAARFAYERDANYGSASEYAREATNRLATVLRTARYALSIPEVSPLAVSFDDSDVVGDSRNVLRSALNFSFLFEINEGRPDRNSQRLNRKIQLNPLLSPRWGLPISRRGDISLSRELVNAIFDPALDKDFDLLLKLLSQKWNYPFTTKGNQLQPQPQLF
jgi:hypothetical protein